MSVRELLVWLIAVGIGITVVISRTDGTTALLVSGYGLLNLVCGYRMPRS